MKKFNFFEKLWEHGRTLRRVGLVLVMCLIAIPQAWAGEEFKGVYMTYDFNGSGSNYEYYSSDNKKSNPVVALGPLTTGTFKITAVYWKTKDNWYTEKINAYGWYNLGGGDTKFAEYDNYTGSNGDNCDCEHEIQNTAVNYTVATANTGNSGLFTFSHWWIVNFHYSGGYTPTYCSNGGDNYNFTYQILPPNATAITATPTGAVSGSGTELDPYIVPYGGNLTIALSGSTKERADDNSSVQYSVDGGSTWGTSSKTFSNVTATSTQNWVFKARCYNSTASLASPDVTEKTVYYKAAQGVPVYKFQMKNSGYTSGNVCGAANTDFEIKSGDGNPLQTLVGGKLIARASTTSQLAYSQNSFCFNGGGGGLLTVKLDNPIKSGDVVRYISNTTSGNTMYLRKTNSSTTTDELTLAGSNTYDIQTQVLPASFAGVTTLCILRKAGTDNISYFEILRPDTLTLNANTGSVSPSALYVARGEATALPHATKANNWHKGWFAASSGGDPVANPYTSTGNRTLYAQYDACSSKTGSLYKFVVKSTLTAGSPFAQATNSTANLNVGNYLSALYGGTLEGYGRNSYLDNTTSAFTLKNNGAYLHVTLDCPLRAGDKVKTIITNNTAYVHYSASQTATMTIATSANSSSYQEQTIPAALVGKSDLYIYRGSGNCNVLYFEIIRPTYTVTAQTSTGTNTYGTVSAGASTLTQGSTTTITAVPADGYQVASWAVSGTGASIDPSGTSNSTTTELTMGSANATVTVTFEEIPSCYAPAAPTISGTADYIVGQTLTLTADISGDNHDASTTYTWYKGADWATASASTPVQDAAVAGSNGHIFTKTAAVGDAGTYWCKASNGTGCESHNSTGKAVTVVYKVTYAANGGTGDAMANSTGTSITLSANSYTAPSGYTFDGWRTVSDKQASGTDYAAGTSGITANLDLYAMWKQTVTLDDNGGSNDGSAVVYYNASSASTPSAPTYSGYTADGYYAESGCTNLVMSTAGALTNYTGYVSGGKWVHSGATTLYAHYKCTAPTITCTDNVVTMSTTSTGATIYYTYTTDGSTPSDPTSSDDAYDPEDKPVITKDTKFKAIAIESGKTSSAVTSQTCAYTAFSSSVNIEQTVLDGGMIAGVKSALDAANITYLNSGLSVDTLNDEPSKGVYKVLRNEPYLGLKIKNEGTWVQVTVPAGSTLKVKFGHIDDALGLSINGEAQDNISSATNGYTYELDAALTPQVVKFTTTTGDAVVFKQIMIGEAIKSVTLPAKITTSAGDNGSITAPINGAKVNVGSTVTITTSPSSGYELSTLTVTRDTLGSPSVSVSNNQFTMPNGNVTINATFVLSGHSVTAVTSTGTDTYGTVSAAAATVAEGGTTVITATPATGYKVTNWAVSGTGASISPSGASNSNTTTLTMGSADATVTVTFGPKTYTLTLDKNGGYADGSATATWNSHTLTDATDATASNLNNYYLDGYYTEADGGTEIIAALPNLVPTEVTGWISPSYDYFWIHDANETLYAHWWTMIILDPNKDHHGTGTVSYDAKGIYNGSMIEGFATAMSDISGESGYSLQGFYTAAVGGTKVLNADGTFAAENITDYVSGGKWIYNGENYARFYARWAKELTVTYDDNDATSGTAPDAVDALYGTTITVADNTGSLVKTSSSFVGWNTANDGTGSFYAVGSEFTLTEDITLYAQWESCSGGDPGSKKIIGYTTATCDQKASSGGERTLSNVTNLTVAHEIHDGGDGDDSLVVYTAADQTMYYGSSSKVYSRGGYRWIKGKSTLGNNTVGFSTTVASGYEFTIDSISFGIGASANFTYQIIIYQDGDTLYKSPIRSVTNYNSGSSANHEFHINGLSSQKILQDLTGTFYVRVRVCQSSTGKYFYLPMFQVIGNLHESSGGCTTHTISFENMSDFAGSSTLPDEIEDVYTGATIAEPVQPTASGYAFAGWYKEGACSNKWDFSTDVVDDDITLYAKWVNVSGKYTFHYGDGNPTDNTWVIKTFTEAGSGYHKIEDFEIPDADRYPSFFVGYEGAYDTETAHSQIYTWDAATGLGNGHMPIRHWGTRYGSQSELPIAGNGNTAEGAKGTLRISTTGSTNCYVGFYPNGYGLTWNRETTALHATPSPEVFETDVVTLTAAEAAGNFEVKLATEGSYVAYSRTATETAEGQLNDRKVAGETYDIAAGTVGRFQINLSKKEDNYGLRFVPLQNRSFGTYSINWTDDNYWTLWRRPNIDEDAYINNSVYVNVRDAQAKKVIISKYGTHKNYADEETANDGRLYVKPQGGLLIATTLKKLDSEGAEGANDNYFDVQIESDGEHGTGALITGSASANTEAYVQLHALARHDAYGYLNQHIGIPFAEGSIYDFYNTYLYVFDRTLGADNENWYAASRKSSKMDPFTAYNLMRKESSEGTIYMDGELNLPGKSGTKALICDDSDEDHDNNAAGDYMFANSWTAPIDIKAIEEEDFANAEATIYIFNAGSTYDEAHADEAAMDATTAGQWISLPVEATEVLENELPLTVIPSMQGFLIKKTGTAATEAKLTLNYNKHVYAPAAARGAAGIEVKPSRAPKRSGVNRPAVMKLYVDAESGNRDKLFILERADFSDAFDNGWDGRKILGESYAPQLYAFSADSKMSIDAISVIEGTVVGFRKGSKDEVYTISFNYDGTGVYYLNDLKEQEATLITNETEYTFVSAAEDAEARFIISATPIQKVPTDIENTASGEQSAKVRKLMIDGKMYIIRSGRMYDALGKRVK